MSACLEVLETPAYGSFYLLYGLLLLCRHISHLELISVYGAEEASRYAGPRRAGNQPTRPLPGSASLSAAMRLTHPRGVCVWVLCPGPWVYLFILESTLHGTASLIPSHFYCLVPSLDIQQTKSSNSALFPKVILLLLSFLCFHVNLGISLPIKKNSC